ncbi:MAG: TrkH family potassium uptake protein, partial [Clostridia bacterium]|nr:TrkH family potassium uptake protein [Clostridia bacterium]
MNRSMVFHILGKVMVAEGLLMLPAVFVGLIYGEYSALSFLPTVFLLPAVGFAASRKHPADTGIYAGDGFVIVAASWLLMSLFGAVPFSLADLIGGTSFFPTFADSFFEIASGFSTTGASVLSSPESLPHCLLFWRSFSHWIGGMGVLVFLLAVVPLSEDRSLHIMRAEVPGPIVGKLLPRMKDTAFILYSVYAGLTLLLIVLLWAGGMPLFDSVCHAFGTAGTGGFSVKDAGIAFYDSVYTDVVISVFMLLFGVNFNLFYFILIGKAKAVFANEELKWYLGIIAFSTLTIALHILPLYDGFFPSLRYSFFQVTSIITTTGYATADFARLFPQYARHLLVLLMAVGACAGSTGGGLKIGRVLILLKSAFAELKHQLHPRSIPTDRLEGKVIDAATIHSTAVYFVMYS